MKDSSKFNRDLTFIGLVLGAIFPILAIALDLVIKDLTLSPASIHEIFVANKLQWIVLSAPIVLGGVFYYLGKIIQERETQLDNQIKKEKEQFTILENNIINLNQRNSQTLNNSGFIADKETKRVVDSLDKFKTKYHSDRDAENQQQWMMNGFNELNTILASKDKIDKLVERIIQFLVNYINYIQGSLFILQEEDEDQFLELRASYAYDRKKFLEKRFEIGDGLVGQCFLEKNRILLYDVPQGYVKITSGLGESTPTCLIIMPLISNDKVEGIIEVAGFDKLQPHELQFLDKAAGNIGNTLSSVKINERTHILLEESQSQAMQMQEQEEEMRQSIEELAATEEEMKRKEHEYILKIEQLEYQQSEMMRIDWENKHKIETLQALVESKKSDSTIEKSFSN